MGDCLPDPELPQCNWCGYSADGPYTGAITCSASKWRLVIGGTGVPRKQYCHYVKPAYGDDDCPDGSYALDYSENCASGTPCLGGVNVYTV